MMPPRSWPASRTAPWACSKPPVSPRANATRTALKSTAAKGGILFDMQRMNELQFFSRSDPEGKQGFHTIQVGEGVHPYMSGWWPAGHIIGFGDTFVHEALEVIDAIAENRPASPSFRDGVACQQILAAVDLSIAERRWVRVKELD